MYFYLIHLLKNHTFIFWIEVSIMFLINIDMSELIVCFSSANWYDLALSFPQKWWENTTMFKNKKALESQSKENEQ